MTKEQFLNGVSFSIKGNRFKGEPTYKYDGGTVSRESRSSRDESIIFTDHEANIAKIGRVGFEAYNFVLGKKIKVKYRFEDLREVE